MPEALTTCPRCGFAQPGATECPRCGVVFWKAAGRPASGAPPRAPVSPASSAGLVTLMLFLFGTAVGLVVLGKVREAEKLARVREAREGRSAPARRSESPESALPAPGGSGGRWGPPPEEPPPSAPSAGSLPVARSEAPISPWYEGADGYRRAEEDRKRYGTAMVVYFHTTWCGWCRKMESDYFSAYEVSSYLDRLPKVKIDPERGQEEAALARQFGVPGYPSFYIVSASGGGGRRVHPFRRNGHMTPAEFVAECRSAE